MPLLNKHELKAILGYLDTALIATRAANQSQFEDDATWSIRCARERLLEAALSDLDIQGLTAGEIEDASIVKQDTAA